MKILLIEDDLLISKAVTYYLKKKSHHVFVSTSGSHAIDLINRDHFDKIITDLMLNDISGFDVLEECKKLELDIRNDIIIITAYNSQEIIKRIQSYKCKYFIKPFENLIDTMEKILL